MMVEYEDWEPLYQQILTSFRFSREQDEEAAGLVNALLPEPRLSIRTLERMIQGNVVYVLGAHDRVESDIAAIEEHGITGVFIVADGACSALRGTSLEPDLIVTDLDGDPDDLLYWNRRGTPAVVHAHGDNLERIRSLAPSFSRSMASTQNRPFGDVHNFGGFTDGDRCVFLADHFGALRIVLCGFSYTEIGKYSFSTDEEMKLRKLRWAERLISLFEVEYFSSE